MGKVYQSIDRELADWISRQHVFFVATAPLGARGSVNCSPKGGDSLRILGDAEVAYQDYTGSGVETVAHLRENGRIVIMFCAFEGKPRIVRLHGRGSVVAPRDARFGELARMFPAHLGTRAIIRIEVNRISDSCGYAVPLYAFQGDRDVLDRWTENKGVDRLREYRRAKNATSIDGLPGLGPGAGEAGSAKIILKGHIIVPDSDLAMVEAELPAHIALTRQEAGCLAFEVTRDSGNRNIFNVYEEFADRASFEAHQSRARNSGWGKATASMERRYQIHEDG